MKNEASNIPNVNKFESKILIKSSASKKNHFDIHIYIENVLEKSILEIKHYHIVAPTIDIAE